MAKDSIYGGATTQLSAYNSIETIHLSGGTYPLRQTQVIKYEELIANFLSKGMGNSLNYMSDEVADDPIAEPDDEGDQENEEDENLVKGESDHEKNMEKYLETFGTEFDIPGIFVQEMKFYPINPEFFAQIVKYKIPENKDVEI